MLLIRRARLVAGALQKISKLKEQMREYANDNHMLVYCGATTIKDPDYREGSVDDAEKKQINIVADMLGNELGMRISKFTSEESAQEREVLKKSFDEGKQLQALVAIRCLDEGVNIPSIKTAFILASSTNPKEYIQRRGRVLRKYHGKTHAVIYDFITLPFSLDEVGDYPSEVVKSTKGLVLREIERMKDFAKISENPWEVDSLINQMEEAFDLNKIKGVDEYV
jgi:superfamily II DNA or RNA helicase